MQILQQAMWGSRASVPADTHTVLSCTAGRHPVDQSLCHHDYRTPHPTARRLVPCRLTPLCLHRGMASIPGSTAHLSTAGARAARCCLRLQHSRHSCYDGLSGRPIFVNFVTFSTKHGSTSNKAYSRLSGSRYVHANAHRLHEAIF